MAILTDEFGVFLTDEFGQYITDEDGMPSLTGDILLVDGVSDLLLTDWVSAALLSGGAGNTGTCRILKTDASSDLLLANGSDHLLLFDCVPVAGDGCRILKADGSSALLLANGVDNLLLFDCVPAVVAPPVDTGSSIGGSSAGSIGGSKKYRNLYRPYRLKKEPAAAKPDNSELVPLIARALAERQIAARPIGPEVALGRLTDPIGERQNTADLVMARALEAAALQKQLEFADDEEAIALLLLT